MQIFSRIAVGQIWINSFTKQRVLVVGVEEYTLTLETSTGVVYTYPFGQFLLEYSIAE